MASERRQGRQAKKNENQAEIERLEQRLRSLKNLPLVTEKFDGKTLEKVRTSMKGIQKYDVERFEEDSSYINLLTRVNLELSEIAKCSSLKKETLNDHPKNISAKLLEIQIYIKAHNYHQADTKLKCLEDIDKKISDRNAELLWQLAIHMADIAFLYYNIGPKYYMKAINLYRRSIASATGFKDQESEKYLIIWRFRLAVLYNRMLNRGNIATFCDNEETDCENITPVNVFHDICGLVKDILHSSFEHNVYKGKCYIELMDAFQKLHHHKNEVDMDVIESALGQRHVDREYCMKMALKLAPNDSGVLEKIGKHYRTNSCSLDDFKKAAQYLQRSVKLCPDRHVSLHQLSLCYRSMWFLENNFEEAKLYNNPARTGRSNPSAGRGRGGRRGRGRGRGRGSTGSYSQFANSLPDQVERSLNFSNATKTLPAANIVYEEQGNNSRGSHSSAHSVPEACNQNDEGNAPLHSTGVNTDASNVQKNVDSTIDISNDTIPNARNIMPRNPVPFDRNPKQYRKPDYFDKLRTSNPVCTSRTVENRYLEEAKECLVRANDVVKGSAIRYLVDLARVCISLNLPDEAEEHFCHAAEPKTSESGSSSELAYVYEQWALFLDHSGADGDELQDIMSKYREATTFSVAARERSRIAFYNLKDIIDSQLMERPSDVCLKKEQALLQKLVRNFANASGKLREVLDSDPNNFELLLELAEVQFENGNFINAYENLHTALVCLPPSEIKYLYGEDQIVGPPKITMEAVKAIGSCSNVKSIDMIRNVFRELTKRPVKVDGDIFIMYGEQSEEKFDVLYDLFEAQKFKHINKDDNPSSGQTSITYYEEAFGMVKCVLLLIDTISKKDTPTEWHILKSIVADNSIRPILLHDSQELEETLAKFPKLGNCPCVSVMNLDNEEDKQRFFLELLEAVYENIELID